MIRGGFDCLYAFAVREGERGNAITQLALCRGGEGLQFRNGRLKRKRYEPFHFDVNAKLDEREFTEGATQGGNFFFVAAVERGKRGECGKRQGGHAGGH